MPRLQGQNPHKGKPGHGIGKLSAVLPKVQAGDIGKCKKAKNNYH